MALRKAAEKLGVRAAAAPVVARCMSTGAQLENMGAYATREYPTKPC
jgi:hypothetical protein